MATSPRSSSFGLLEPEALHQLSSMELRAQLIVEGFITGMHKSPYHGFSVEFAEHRPYNAGDDIRHVDWRVFAKSDRYYIKQYEEETNLRHYVVLDTSSSMNYRPTPASISKLHYSAYLAAGLSYLMVKQRDATGLLTFADEVEEHIEPSTTAAHLRRVFLSLEHTFKRPHEEPSRRRGTGLLAALHDISDRVHRRAFIVILTDLLDPSLNPESLQRALRHLRSRGHEVLLLHVLHRASEVNLEGYDGPVILEDMETGKEQVLQPHQIRTAYQEEVRNFTETVRRICLENRIGFEHMDTAASYHSALSAYLNRRKRFH